MQVKNSMGDRIFQVVNHMLLLAAVLVVTYPLYIILIASVSDPYAVMRGEVLLYPKNISTIGYERLLKHKDIWTAYKNTVIYTVAGTSLNLIVTLMAGYALSRNFIGKKWVNLYFVFTMFFSGGLIPAFLQVKSYGLYNSPWVMVLMGMISVWNVIIARTFIKNSLPDELYEAAVMDGCSHVWYFIKIVVPLSKALIGVLVVYYAVAHWNDYMTGLVYISNRRYQPLQVVLKELLTSLQVTDSISQMLGDVADNELMMRVAESVKYCAIVISTVPILVLYSSMQKFFVKGVLIGSVKG